MDNFNQDIWTADFETTTEKFNPERTDIWLACLANRDTGQRYLATSFKEFLIKCFKYKVKRVYFHNISFDGRFIEHGLIDLGYKPLEDLDDELEPNTYQYIKNRNADYFFHKGDVSLWTSGKFLR